MTDSSRKPWLERSRPPWVQALVDFTGVLVASLLTVFLRYDFSAEKAFAVETVSIATGFALIVVVAGALLGLYKGRWRFGSFEEVSHLVLALALALVATTTTELVWSDVRKYAPRSFPIMCSALSLLSLAAIRFLWRIVLERKMVRASSGGRRVLIAGAGEAGEQIIQALHAHPENGRNPIGLLDDDPLKRHLVFHGVKVIGRLMDLRRAAVLADAEELLIAIPSADSELVSRLTEQAERLGMTVTVLPTTLELLSRGGQVGVRDIRRVSIVDLLGREPVDRDLSEAVSYVWDKRILVTGAGGSIGAELCRQLQRLHPRQILLFDHDESNLHGLQLELRGQALLDLPELIIGDVRDRCRLEAVFRRHQPDIVFHAAAHKHLPLLEMHPTEAVKTNVIGTLNVARVAADTGCTHVINISTDKAAEPTSVLGASKRVAELICQWFGEQRPETVFASVRFGNVLGSRGSVLPVLEGQVASGGPVTLTHPEATRYFMTILEAAQLVIRASALARGGEVMVLDMGDPVPIRELARKVIDLAASSNGKPKVRICYFGLRPGEKLHEQLFFREERDRTTALAGEKIFSCPPGPLVEDFDLHLGRLIDAALADHEDGVWDCLSVLVPGYAGTRAAAVLGPLYPDGF